MKKTVALLALMFCLTTPARSDTQQCREQAAIDYRQAIEACDGAGGGGADTCVRGRTCGNVSGINGSCLFYNETTICGRHCATADQCGGVSGITGRCNYFDTTAQCGNNSCTVSKTCGAVSGINGQCLYFNETVSCN